MKATTKRVDEPKTVQHTPDCSPKSTEATATGLAREINRTLGLANEILAAALGSLSGEQEATCGPTATPPSLLAMLHECEESANLLLQRAQEVREEIGE